ncbi:MAG: PIN domain nuclease [Actinobacteria bacterium]|nr:PIN domain nuclease [Actinomycetota bacterium]
MTQEWLIDKSAFVRLGQAADKSEWLDRIERGLVHVCTVTLLEIGDSAISSTALEAERHRPPLSALVHEYATPGIEDRAIQVQSLLAQRAQHRGPAIPDILVAATAELMDLTVLHLDKDYDLIAAITGQPTQRLAVTT